MSRLCRAERTTEQAARDRNRGRGLVVKQTASRNFTAQVISSSCRPSDCIAQDATSTLTTQGEGTVSFDAERTGLGHADRFWAIVLACQKGCR